MKALRWIIFGFFAIGVGLYPILYVASDMNQGLLSTKPLALKENPVWSFFFYQHIIFGGLALLTGWTQFNKKWRSQHVNLHRTLGKIYVIVCLLSGTAGLYLAFSATGGWIASLGFMGLAMGWLTATLKAYLSIRQKKITDHEDWMTRSYALTFAAVTLRIWLPLSQIAQLDFITAYVIIAWLCWVPNLLVAEVIIRSRRRALGAVAS